MLFDVPSAPPRKRRRGIGAHHKPHRGDTDNWLTPPAVIKALGPFDLDPCAHIVMPWATARKHYTINEDGLAQKWEGRVWLNPPYGLLTGMWLEKLAAHGNGLALIFARTDTEWFHRRVWEAAWSLLFLEGRLTFFRPNGVEADHNAGGPSVVCAYDEENGKAMRESGLTGAFVDLKKLGAA